MKHVYFFYLFVDPVYSVFLHGQMNSTSWSSGSLLSIFIRGKLTNHSTFMGRLFSVLLQSLKKHNKFPFILWFTLKSPLWHLFRIEKISFFSTFFIEGMNGFEIFEYRGDDLYESIKHMSFLVDYVSCVDHYIRRINDAIQITLRTPHFYVGFIHLPEISYPTITLFP